MAPAATTPKTAWPLGFWRRDLVRGRFRSEGHLLWSRRRLLSHRPGADTGSGVTALDSIEIAITALRTGPALATPDLLVLHPSTSSKLRCVKDAMERFMVAPDPMTDEANSLWGIPVVQSGE